ncbi:hypothetical protein KIN20_032094 [Parelaphostrongylus tenuis]|uniref:FAM192A/Fyv6 N-terminal domain-containing protein n=1 Tax=Parelaphostrongylus tenuis TaxID=148309 RepID=A0AAD5R6G8_PARTN|nr:hypothetical protein KIN20_032094 [Parelaphostrongylus tenuis]
MLTVAPPTLVLHSTLFTLQGVTCQQPTVDGPSVEEMSSGFVSTSELEEMRKRRQEEWERVRKPDDPLSSFFSRIPSNSASRRHPEPEVCNKSLYEQLRDNKEAKQAELDEARRFKNMIRGIDEDESDFLARVNEMKAAEIRRAKKEEEEALREAALARNQQNLVEPPTVSQLKGRTERRSTTNIEASCYIIVSYKRKSTGSNGENSSAQKVSRVKEENSCILPSSTPQPTVSAMRIIGSIPGIGTYEASSDSASSNSDDEEDPYIPVLQTTVPQKKNTCEE